MKELKHFFLIHLFTLAGIAVIYSRWIDNSTYEWIFKPFLMPLLALFLFLNSDTKGKGIYFMLISLFFSWLGDIFLIEPSRHSSLFILGLASFLIAHIAYILSFAQTPFSIEKSFIRRYPAIVLPFIGYIGWLLSKVWEGAADKKMYILAYAIVITLMALSALNRKNKVPMYSFGMVFTGAVLFVISDSMIAWSRFHQDFENAGIYIMITYIVAQYLIVNGYIFQQIPQDNA